MPGRSRAVAAAPCLVGLAVTGLLAAGCAREASDTAELERAAKALSVSVLRPGAERAFARNGHPIRGALACASVSASSDDGNLAVECSGLTHGGDDARFEGILLREELARREDGDDSLRGRFTGTVGEDRVFEMNCFQCAPARARAGFVW